MNTLAPSQGLHIKGIDFSPDKLIVSLSDQRVLALPLEWYPRLFAASDTERRDWRLLGGGEGIHWPSLDEDLSLGSFLNGWPAAGSAEYRRRRTPIECVTLADDLAGSFQSERQVNEALREYLRIKRESA
jgi:hypothetical protein